MPDPFHYYRRSLRLRKHHYARGGVYFVTLCARERECLFGEITGVEMRLSDCGKIIRDEWLHTETTRQNVLLDAYVIMPNHIHGVIILTSGIAAEKRRPTWFNADLERARAAVPDSVAAVLTQFKSITTQRIRALTEARTETVWQDQHTEQRIWSEQILERIREYIASNPTLWDQDENNPTVNLPN